MDLLIPLYVRLPYTTKQENGWVIADCVLLRIASQGRDPEEAKDNLRRELEFFLRTVVEMGTLEDVLHDCQFKKVPRQATDPDGVIIDGLPHEPTDDWLLVQVPPTWMVSTHGDARTG